MWLHAETLKLRHPGSEAPVSFHAPADFDLPAASALRAACVAADETDAFRLVHGAADGSPGWYVDQLDGWLLSQSEQAAAALPAAADAVGADRPHYHKVLRRQTRETGVVEASPQLVRGSAVPARFVIRENGVRYEVSFGEGGSVGLFLDQRDNRRRLLVNHVAVRFPLIAGDAADREVLNCFAYTCGFSVCAALAGARATSLDLSRKYLEWGRRNFSLNGLDPAAHDFIHGDVFDWLRRLAKKRRQFDVVLLDPPTFSRSKERGEFRAESDFGGLVTAALSVLRPGGVLFASTTAARLTPPRFLSEVHGAVRAAKRRAVQEHYVPQPPDFPITRDEPAHLKTVWLRVE
jgi:23S rRNA (cytosine1962-C5)-methyltransferase